MIGQPLNSSRHMSGTNIASGANKADPLAVIEQPRRNSRWGERRGFAKAIRKFQKLLD